MQTVFNLARAFDRKWIGHNPHHSWPMWAQRLAGYTILGILMLIVMPIYLIGAYGVYQSNGILGVIVAAASLVIAVGLAWAIWTSFAQYTKALAMRLRRKYLSNWTMFRTI